MKPTKDCPFVDQYDGEESLFCIECMYYKRSPENDYNEGMKIDYRMAFICEKYCMKPDIYYEEEEPTMPWE